ncbi:MAG: hypothetical protein JXB49_27880 [Bacteroidales bacterium]|nr:hypothetical protein [Bacteroidales bacterium]
MNRRILYCSLVLLCYENTLTRGQINYQANFQEEFKITEEVLYNGNTYSRVQMSGLQRTDSIGYPVLPVKYVKLLIPPGTNATGVVINNSVKQVVDLNYLVEPFQPPVPTSIHYEAPDFVPPDSQRYHSSLPYPVNIVEIAEQGHYRGNCIVTLAFYPCRYFPGTNKLEEYSLLDISLQFETSSKAGLTKEVKAMEDGKHKKILEYLVDNKEDVDKFAIQYVKQEEKASSNLLKSGSGIMVDCDYVIVTSEAFAPAFGEFMAWKKRKGIDIELVTIEDIVAAYTGDEISGIYDDAGKLRQFLAEAYDDGNGIEYALLAGDHTIVPVRYGFEIDNTTNANHIIPTDLYFADFNGDWEVDNDGRYGEPYVSSSGDGDDVDFDPEIYIGRIMVTSTEEAKNWTAKIKTYEMNPGNGDYSYLKRAFYTQADQLQRDHQANYIAGRFNTVFDTYDIWEEYYDGLPCYDSPVTPDSPEGRNIIARINSTKYGFVSWFAHGSPLGVAVGTKGINESGYNSKFNVATLDDYDLNYGSNFMDETDNGLDDMTNIGYPTIAYTVACDVMPFDDYIFNDPLVRNMGEAFTCISNGGGPHFLGNTRMGYVEYSYLMLGLFANLINNGVIFNIGIAEAISKQNYSGGYRRYLNYTHNLIGCPETELWTNIPSEFATASITENGSDITVYPGYTSWPEFTRITVMSTIDNGNSYFESRLVTPQIPYSTFINVPEPYTVTITHHSKIPYLVDPASIYIQNESLSVDNYIIGGYFYAGTNVTTTKHQGPVVIPNGSIVVFDAENDVTIQGDFEVELGAGLEIK